MSWADFRGKLLGPTDPASAPEGSLRQQIYSKWSELGRSATGPRGVQMVWGHRGLQHYIDESWVQEFTSILSILYNWITATITCA